MKKLCIAASLLMIGFNVKGQNALPTSGNVGVGTTSPGSKLQVSGTPSDRVLISNSTVNYSTNSPKLSLFGYSTGTEITGPSLQKISTGGYGHGRLAIFQHGGADYTSEKEVMSILPNGNVGIGTSTPEVELHLNGISQIEHSNGRSIRIDGYEGISTYGASHWLHLNRNSNDNVAIGHNSTANLFLVNGGGKIGVGTISPSEKLTVVGDVSIGEGGAYKDVVFKTGNTISGYNGVFEIAPKTVPGSGTAQHATYFKNGAEVNGKSVHNVFIDGKVGIGTVSPKGKLDVNGGYFSRGREVVVSDGLSSYVKTAGNIYFENSNGVLSTILNNGNMGIGTQAPTEKLDVNGTIKAKSTLKVEADGGTGHLASRIILNSHDNYRGAGIFSIGTTNTWFTGNPYTDHANSFMIGVAQSTTSPFTGIAQKQYAKFYINQNGNVGIGTTTPDAKLAVNGKIHTKEVKVDLIGWSDFVFYENYDLPTLKEVEDHIKAKGHLKDIPSEKEVVENGIQLGEMNAKLLQKIEELTLYTIQQEKKIQKQEEEINALKDVSKRLEKLEKLLSEKN